MNLELLEQACLDELTKIASAKEKESNFDIKSVVQSRAFQHGPAAVGRGAFKNMMSEAAHDPRATARAAMQRLNRAPPPSAVISPPQKTISPVIANAPTKVLGKVASAEHESVKKEIEAKFPNLKKEKSSNYGGSESYGAAPLPSSFSAPSVGKMASAAGMISKALGPQSRVGQHLARNSHAYDLAGLGVLAAPSVGELGEQAHKKMTGGKVDGKGVAKSVAEIGGLGMLAAPVAATMLRGGH